MKLIKEENLPIYPYNYKYLLDIEIDEGNKETGSLEKDPLFMPVQDYMTPTHFLNNYYFKPIAKYFKEDEFQRR